MSNPNAASRFDEIYNSTNKAVLTLIIAKCGRTSDIQDIFQDTFLELYHVLLRHGVKYVTNEKALIFKIAKRKIAKHYTLAQRLRIFDSLTLSGDDGEEAELLDREAETFLTEDFVANKMLLETARNFIKQKPEDVKKVFYLFYDLGLTIPEIAKSLSITESSVKNKLYRTLKQLRILLEEGECTNER
jgi:RNA polymerase sigma-70 factor (ECF subfamily)